MTNRMTNAEAINYFERSYASGDTDDEQQHNEAIGKAIKALEQTRWIPVSERLPEEGEPILFSTKTGGVYEGAYFDLIDNRQWYAYKDENYAWNNIVTAWMPLPTPYKAESEDEE